MRAEHRYSWRLIIAALICLLVGTALLHGQTAHASTPCPCHVFGTSDPSTAPSAFNDGTPMELGMRFKVYVDGYITGVRFYKDVSMTDTHTGNLWDSTGHLLASGTYSNETSSGWQDLTFASPVSVTGGHYYTASFYTTSGKYTATPSYFTSQVDNYPLNAPSSSTASGLGLVGNGVYAQGSDAYPGTTFNGNNYWVDVTFKQTVDGSAPQVMATNPTNGSNNAYTTSTLTATVNQNLATSSVNSSTVALTDSKDNPIAASVSYNDSTKTISIQPTSPLTDKSTYIASIRGGPSGIHNLDGTPMAADYQWSFTTNNTCPCSIWGDGSLIDNPLAPTDTSVELGQKIHADANGYIEALRFYKAINSTASTHTLHIWTTSGTLLATATTSHETAYGWQEAKLASGLAITQGQDYVISYYASDGVYTYSIGPLATIAGSGALHADASSADFLYGSDAFPSNSIGDTRTYWLDAVFTTSDPYTAPFTVTSSQPAPAAYGVSTSATVNFHLSNAVDVSTVTGAVTLKDASNNTVAGTTTYDDSEHTITFTPSQALSTQRQYTATLSSALKDVYGTALGTPYDAHFTTGAALNTDISQGMGGPVLVVTSSANPYDTYLAEILRTEGINYFTVKDVSQLTSATLASYHMVLLGKSTLNASQVTALSSWVDGGGNLIALQPDKQLASLLGLSDKNQSLSEGYLKVDTSQAPGKGITAETMQYHGSADVYQNDSAQVVATLYQDATTTASSPAVTTKTVGTGHAAAFMYDLPKSIALTHQGNPAWAGQERDGNTPIRPNDMFYGGAQTDWLNVTKAYIPQADEQQRLLVNMMLNMSQSNTPMPRFWILPHGYKTALVMVGDDHGTTSGTFDTYNYLLNHSPANCSVSDWQCARAGSFLYTTSGLTAAQANEMYVLGFSMGVHISTGCGNYSSLSNLESQYTSQLSAFQAKYTGLPAQQATRTHCFVWSDWDSTPKADSANNIHYNMNYEWYPPAWTGSNTGYLTGSGLNMRFTDASGNLLDDYQGVTDLDYETDPSSTSMNTDLDNAVGSNEFYGVLGTHYDYTESYNTQLVAAAEAHNVPMISPDQMLTWKDGLDSSTFTNISSSASKLYFTVQIGQGGEGAEAMIPASTSSGSLVSVSQGSSAVTYTTTTVKGITYAVFDAQPGSYEALYGPQSSGSVTSNGVRVLLSGSSSPSNIIIASITNKSPFTNNGSVASQAQTPANRQGAGGSHGGTTSTFTTVIKYAAGIVAVSGTIAVVIRLKHRLP